MKKADVKVGGRFSAKVSDKVVVVRIDAENPHGGWDATNEATGKKVRIKSAQRLRGEVRPTRAAGKAGDAPAAAGGPDTTRANVGREGASPVDAKAEKAAKTAAWRKEVAEKVAQPDPALDAALEAAGQARRAKSPNPPRRVGEKAKAARPMGERKGGCLDAAVEVLKVAGGGPLGTKEMVERMLAKGLWKTKGKTPAATLYAAIIREIAAKGKAARFRKTARGQFELIAAARQ